MQLVRPKKQASNKKTDGVIEGWTPKIGGEKIAHILE